MTRQIIGLGTTYNDGTGDPIRDGFSKTNDNFAELYGWQVPMPSYTVVTLPSASTAGRMIYVSNESGGAVVAFSDGSSWRRVTDRAIVS